MRVEPVFYEELINGFSFTALATFFTANKGGYGISITSKKQLGKVRKPAYYWPSQYG